MYLKTWHFSGPCWSLNKPSHTTQSVWSEAHDWTFCWRKLNIFPVNVSTQQLGSLRLGRPDSEEGWKNEDWVSTLVGSTSNQSVSFAIFISVGNGILKGEITLVREKLWRNTSMGPISRLGFHEFCFEGKAKQKTKEKCGGVTRATRYRWNAGWLATVFYPFLSIRFHFQQQSHTDGATVWSAPGASNSFPPSKSPISALSLFPTAAVVLFFWRLSRRATVCWVWDSQCGAHGFLKSK